MSEAPELLRGASQDIASSTSAPQVTNDASSLPQVLLSARTRVGLVSPARELMSVPGVPSMLQAAAPVCGTCRAFLHIGRGRRRTGTRAPWFFLLAFCLFPTEVACALSRRSNRCNDDDVTEGDCALCKEPLWCDDPSPFGFNGSIKTPEDWVDAFFLKDGGFSRGHRQCKYKRTQKQQFIDTIRHRFAVRRERGYETDPGKYYASWDQANFWNEARSPVFSS